MATPQMQRSFPEVLQDIVGNLQEIIRSEFRLAKTELKEEAARASKPAATFGVGLVLGFYGIGFLLLALICLGVLNHRGIELYAPVWISESCIRTWQR
jgi:uncharacterized membrane protein YqjE